MANLAALAQMAQQLQGGTPMDAGMAATGPADMVSETPDILTQLKALMGSGIPTGSVAAPRAAGPMPMMAALQDRMAATGMPRTPGPDINRTMAMGATTGPATDSDYYEMHEANQGVRGDLPPQPQRDYSGYGEEMEPMDDIRQTPRGYNPGDGEADTRFRPNIGAEGAPGQAIMGAYLNRNKGAMSTEDELADVQKRMGADPVADGNFPSQKEIDDLINGKISPTQFDARWGKGAAAEMQDKAGDDADEDDDGDHEYR